MLTLVEKYEKSSFNNLEILKSASKVKLVVQNTPNIPIEKLGPYLYKYESKLRERKVDELLKVNYVAENNLTEVADSEVIDKFISAMRDFWVKSTTDEQTYILNKVNEMCEFYMEYLLLAIS
jgi:hypothetical protein